MTQYLRALICIFITYIHFFFIKIFHWKNFAFYGLNVFSPFTDIDIRGSGEICFNGVKTRSGSKIKVRNNAKLTINKGSSLNYGCMIVCREKVEIGKNVQFGPNVLIYDHDHNFRIKDGLKRLDYITSPVVIGDNVWVGANTVILRGTTIGDNCVIGAGSVISGKFASDSIIVQKRQNTVFDNVQIK